VIDGAVTMRQLSLFFSCSSFKISDCQSNPSQTKIKFKIV